MYDLTAQAPPDPAPRPRWRARDIAIVVGVWTLLGLLAGIQQGLTRLYYGEAPGWGRLITVALADWMTCAAFTPVFLWLVRRFPVGRTAWLRVLPIYIIVTAIAVVLKYAVFVPFRQAFFPMPGYTLGRVLVNSFFFEFLAFCAVIGVAQAIEYYRADRERELRSTRLETQLARAQLEVLRGQIHPHFLFNTLHGISTLMHRDVNAADEMLTRLSDLLRLTLERGGVQEVTLGEELAVLERYLAIMRIRFGDRLAITLDVDPAALDRRVPHFLLQPLVENAIEHGVARHAGAGRVEIRARCAGDGVVITVTDDGPGLAASGEHTIREGIGLTNTRRRLEQLYGSGAQLILRNRVSRGVEVLVVVPANGSAGAGAALT